MSTPTRFLFRANVSGLGCHYRRPANRYLDVQGSCSIPVTGGKAGATVEWADYQASAAYAGLADLRDFVTFQKITSSATADFTDRAKALAMTYGKAEEADIPTKTTTEAMATGITIGGRVVLGEVKACMIAEQPTRGNEPHIRPKACKFVDVTIDGHTLVIRTDTTAFSEKPTKVELCSAYEGDEEYFGRHGRQFLATGLPVRSKTRKTPQARGVILATIVTSMTWKGAKHPEAAVEGHMIHVPGIGRIYFGEILITETSRRLTMVRAKLGSDVGGEGAGIEVETNGLTWPT